ncbi:MAG: hypothetical protein Q8R70_10575 [Methanoregula sp.]|nr:hypothetical protein [Methanoregula sp.]
MSGLSVKVAIKQEFDGDEGGMVWRAEVKDWGLKAQDRMLEGALLIIQRKVITYLQDTFGSRRQITVNIGAASARVEFDIEVATNRSLDEFSITARGNEENFTATISGPDGRSVTCTQQQLELFNELMNRCEVTGENPEDLLAAVKKKSAAKKGKGADE